MNTFRSPASLAAQELLEQGSTSYTPTPLSLQYIQTLPAGSMARRCAEAAWANARNVCLNKPVPKPVPMSSLQSRIVDPTSPFQSPKPAGFPALFRRGDEVVLALCERSGYVIESEYAGMTGFYHSKSSLATWNKAGFTRIETPYRVTFFPATEGVPAKPFRTADATEVPPTPKETFPALYRDESRDATVLATSGCGGVVIQSGLGQVPLGFHWEATTGVPWRLSSYKRVTVPTTIEFFLP